MADIEYRFGTGQGDPHVHHTEATVDVNHDGVADGVALDFDGDGRVDDVLWDSDGDGIADTALLDLDDDGNAESAYNDPTGMGTWNAKGQGGHHETTPASAPEQPKPEEPKPEEHQPDDEGHELPKGHETGEEHPSDYEPFDPSGHEDGTGDAGHLFDNLRPGSDDEDSADLFDGLLEHEDGADAREEWYEELET